MKFKIPFEFQFFLYRLDLPKELLDFENVLVDQDPIEIERRDKFYWENFVHQIYSEKSVVQIKELSEWKQKFKTFFQENLKQGKISLISYDITEAVMRITNFTYHLGSFTCNLNLTLSLKKLAKIFGLNINKEDFDLDKLMIPFIIRENDLIILKVKILKNNQEEQWFDWFVGSVTSLTKTVKYGEEPNITVNSVGLFQKILTLTEIVRKEALGANFIEDSFGISSKEISIFQDNFNYMDAGQIFKTILENSLFLTYQKIDNSKKNPEILEKIIENYTSLDEYKEKLQIEINEKNKENFSVLFFYFDDQKFNNIKDFSSNILSLIPYYLYLNGQIKNRNFEKEKDIPKSIDEFIKEFSFPLGILEGGTHKVFNLMISKVLLFYPTISKPVEVLNSIKDLASYDVFVTPNCQIICRPPQINDLLLDEQYIIQNFDLDQSNVLEYTFYKSDTNLVNFVATKFVFPLIGVQNFPSGSYSDLGLIFRYGFRSEIIDNPNVRDPWVSYFFSKVFLELKNALTRQINIKVRLDRYFKIGYLYFIEPLCVVGYLNQVTNDFVFGQVPTSTLNFVMVRKVYLIRELYEKLRGEFIRNQDQVEPEILEGIFDDSNQKIQVVELRPENLISQIPKEIYFKEFKIKLGDKEISKPLINLFYFRKIPSIMDLMKFLEKKPEVSESVVKEIKKTRQVYRKATLASPDEMSFYEVDILNFLSNLDLILKGHK